MTASDILADLDMTLGSASKSDVQLAYRLADDGGTIQAGAMIALVGYSDPTLHTATSLRRALHLIGCEDAS